MSNLINIPNVVDWISKSRHFPDAISRLMSHSTDLIENKHYFHEASGTFLMQMRMGDNAEGPPGHVHGGFTVAILDEVMGGAAWCNGYPVLLANISVSLRKSIPLGETLYCAGITTRIDTRRIYTFGKIFDAEGKLYSSAEGVFIRIPESHLTNTSAGFERFQEYISQKRNGASAVAV